jgi:hypothetical protein
MEVDSSRIQFIEGSEKNRPAFQAVANRHSSEPLQLIRILIELPISIFRIETNRSRFV